MLILFPMKRVFSLLKVLRKRFRQSVFPTEQDISIKKWRADDGDHKLIPIHDLDENALVFDIGGFHGHFAAEIYARYSCNILIFEPVPSFINIINNRFEKNHKIKVYDFGLGGETRTEKMSVNSVSSSTYRTVSNETIDIHMIDILDWLEKNSVEYVDLMKINIEGGEYELLDRLLASDYISKINEFQIQFHNFFPEASTRMKTIQDKLSQTHQLTYQYPFIWENWIMKTT